MRVSAGFATETPQATFLAGPGLYKQTGNMTWAPINFLKILNDSKDLIKCFTAEAAASNYGFGICEVASRSPALWLKMQAVIIALSEHNPLLLPSYTLLCELVCPQPSTQSAEVLINLQNTFNIGTNSCGWSCKALWKCKPYAGRPWFSRNYHLRGQLQALSLLLEAGHAGKVWDLPPCEGVVTAVPHIQDPSMGTSIPRPQEDGCVWAEAGLEKGNKAGHSSHRHPSDSKRATVPHWSVRSSWFWERHSQKLDVGKHSPTHCLERLPVPTYS